MAGYRDLDVWELSMQVVESVYRYIEQFPDRERFALAEQLRRSAVSVPSNIAEGSARNSKKEFIQFLHIALGSLYALQTQLEIAQRLGYIKVSQECTTEILRTEKMLNSLIASMKRTNQ